MRRQSGDLWWIIGNGDVQAETRRGRVSGGIPDGIRTRFGTGPANHGDEEQGIVAIGAGGVLNGNRAEGECPDGSDT